MGEGGLCQITWVPIKRIQNSTFQVYYIANYAFSTLFFFATKILSLLAKCGIEQHQQYNDTTGERGEIKDISKEGERGRLESELSFVVPPKACLLNKTQPSSQCVEASSLKAFAGMPRARVGKIVLATSHFLLRGKIPPGRNHSAL